MLFINDSLAALNRCRRSDFGVWKHERNAKQLKPIKCWHWEVQPMGCCHRMSAVDQNSALWRM